MNLKKFFLKVNRVFLLIIFLLIILYNLYECNSFVFFEYFKIKFASFNSFQSIIIDSQFVSSTNQNTRCYLTVTEVINNQYGDPELYQLYLPRLIRIVLQQLLIFLLFSWILFRNIKIKKLFYNLNTEFTLITIFGSALSYFVVSLYVNFEQNIYIYIYLIFSLLKSFIIFNYLNNSPNHLKLFILCLFPFFSTGYGIPWLFDFLIYYFIFNFFKKYKYYKRNSVFLLLVSCLILSFVSPILISPSIESSIINNPEEFENIIDNVDFENNKQTYLENKDIRFLRDNITSFNQEELNSNVISLSKNFKDINYPNRWGIMVSYLPDFNFHIPSALWYLVSFFLFFEVLYQIKSKSIDDLREEISSCANILIFYPLLSIFLGISNFFNSFSELLFFLTRGAEIINFGEIQTWRGINTHYEIFGNLQLFCFCFFLLNYYLSKSFKNYSFLIFSILSTLLSQSRFNALVLFILLSVLLIIFYKSFIKELVIIIAITSLIFQFIPIFERNEPFFINESTAQESPEVDTTISNEFGFEIISDRLNRTLPWAMFASGYNPNTIELLFGHGSGGYLNIIKFTERDIASGPHSMILQVLNRFGILGLILLVYGLLKFLFSNFIALSTGSRILMLFIFSILFSLELKTDSLMLTDGVFVFLFNLVNISLLLKFIPKKDN
tara:strand:+ start:3640 stop:5643 length:2004 start_codon:yes stop_codon:yes gene_type:complete